MTVWDMVRELREKRNISIAELCRHLCQTSQNFNKKLQRDTVTFKEMIPIANALGIGYTNMYLFCQRVKGKNKLLFS